MRRLVVVVALVSGCELVVNTRGLDGGCPPLAGTTLVQVGSPGGSYCIDATEVTNAQYTQFLASGFLLASQPPGCEQVTDMTPGNDWPPPPGYDTLPVAQVNWCQASNYCGSVGKRLCGQIGGGALAVINDTQASLSQWLYACTDGGTLAYPYGATYDPTACGGQNTGMEITPVGSRQGCVGGLPGLHDMSGNVWEWTDTCQSTDPGAFCHAVGGGFDSTANELQCSGERNWTRTDGAANIGIRCCFDL